MPPCCVAHLVWSQTYELRICRRHEYCAEGALQSELGVYPVHGNCWRGYNKTMALVAEEGPMKPAKSGGIKGRVVVTRTNEEAKEEVQVYREGRLGLAFRSPSRRLFTHMTQPFRSAVTVKPRTSSDVNPQS